MQEIAELLGGCPLSDVEAERLFEKILTGKLDDAQIAGVLASIQTRGVTVGELVGGARAMRAHVERVPYVPGPDDRLVDTCGTGGAPKTFNVSTAAAIVAASADDRVRVAKHGNRSRTGRGSAEVLAALGVNIDASPEAQAECLREARVCFCFAIHHHPAMRYAAGPRRSLGVPTIFNLLGPLTNPAGARRQLIGVYRREHVDLVAAALADLGVDRAIVVHSREGLDEIGLATPTDAAFVEGGDVTEIVIDPSTLGLAPTPRESLAAATVDDAVAIIRGVLAGEEDARSDIVVVNSAAALWAAGVVNDLPAGIERSREAIRSGRAGATLELLQRLSCRFYDL